MDQKGVNVGEVPERAIQEYSKRRKMANEATAGATAELEPASTFHADMRKMINNPSYSDIVFQCKDGGRVHASRLFLVARSEVFRRMLTNGMAESQLSEIQLRETSTADLLTVMEFLYTGILKDHAPKGLGRMFQIISTSRFFLLDGLESSVFKGIQGISRRMEMEMDMVSAAKYLSIAVAFVAPLGDIAEPFARDLVRILLHKPLEPIHLQEWTPPALEYFLGSTRAEATALGCRGTLEFLRFRAIVLWCTTRLIHRKRLQAMNDVPPEIKVTLELLDKSPDQAATMTGAQFATYSRIRDRLALCVRIYHVRWNLRDIPPRFLARVIEPMQLLPPRIIIEALMAQALYSDGTLLDLRKFALGWSKCMNDELYKMYINRSKGDQKAACNGFASFNFPIHSDKIQQGVYEWDIVIEDVCEGFIEVGLHNNNAGYSHNGDCLSRQPGGWALRMDSTGISVNREFMTYPPRTSSTKLFPTYPAGKNYSKLVYGKDYGHRNCRVKFCLTLAPAGAPTLPREERQCSFTVDDVSLGTRWSDIPKGVLYPAVSLGTGSTGAVRIQLLRGFATLTEPAIPLLKSQ